MVVLTSDKNHFALNIRTLIWVEKKTADDTIKVPITIPNISATWPWTITQLHGTWTKSNNGSWTKSNRKFGSTANSSMKLYRSVQNRNFLHKMAHSSYELALSDSRRAILELQPHLHSKFYISTGGNYYHYHYHHHYYNYPDSDNWLYTNETNWLYPDCSTNQKHVAATQRERKSWRGLI